MDIETIRADFPVLSRKINGRALVYLDNAATSQCPESVINAMNEFYRAHKGGVHRGVHKLSEESTQMYEESHGHVAKFINANEDDIIFTKNATESLNLAANALGSTLKSGDEIVLTQMEHHSSMLPWQQIALRKQLKLNYISIKNYKLDIANAKELINENTKVVAITHASNVLGTVNNVWEISKLAHKFGACVIIDAAQSAPHMQVDVKELDADFLAISGHKMLGPTGIGVLYGRKKLLESMPQFLVGGGTIKKVSWQDTVWADAPMRFEAGSPNTAEAVGLSEAIKYLKKIGLHNIHRHETKLTKLAIELLNKNKYITQYGPKYKERVGIASFNLGNVHAHDVAAVLDEQGIAVRGGHMCCMPLVTDVLKVNAVVRASFYLYNTEEEVKYMAENLRRAERLLL